MYNSQKKWAFLLDLDLLFKQCERNRYSQSRAKIIPYTINKHSQFIDKYISPSKPCSPRSALWRYHAFDARAPLSPEQQPRDDSQAARTPRWPRRTWSRSSPRSTTWLLRRAPGFWIRCWTPLLRWAFWWTDSLGSEWWMCTVIFHTAADEQGELRGYTSLLWLLIDLWLLYIFAKANSITLTLSFPLHLSFYPIYSVMHLAI